MANAFTLSGSNPNNPNPQMQTSTPQSFIQPYQSQGGIIKPPASPSSTISKQTHALPDGSQVTTHYDTTNTYQPLLDYQRQNGGDTSMSGLASLASSKGLSGYTGTDQQNMQLAGLLKPVQSTSQATSQTQPQTGMMGSPAQPPQTNITFPGLVNSLATTAQGQNPINPLIQQTADRVAELKKQEANQLLDMQRSANLEQMTPGTNSYQTGRVGLIQNIGNATMQNLAAQESATQSALQNQLAAQGQQIAGLGQAASLASPQQYGITSTPYSPTTNQFGTLPGGSNGTFDAGQVQGNLGVGQQSSQLQAVERQAQNLSGQLTQFLDQNGGVINPLGFSVVNGLVQLGANQIGNPTYQTFQNLVNDLISKYATILTPAGGNPTDLRLQIASSLINPKASPDSIKQVLQGLETQAQGVVKALDPNQSGVTFGSFFQ